jgi:hypothetical protein
MMSDESSANSEHETPISFGVKIGVRAPRSNKVHNDIQQELSEVKEGSVERVVRYW